MATLRRLLQDEDGATTSEYALALCVMAVALITAIRMFAEPIGDTFHRSASGMTAK